MAGNMTWIENMEWQAEVINSNKSWKAHVYHVSDLAKFAQLHGKNITVTNKN